MATVTYYFNAYVTPVWADIANLIDGDEGTFASTGAKKTAQIVTGNNCPGDNLGTITKVEIRLFGHGDGGDHIQITPIFTGGNGDEHETTPVVDPGDWTPYQDITNDTNAEDWAEWSDIQSLDCIIDSDAVGKANAMYCSKVEVRVTYTPPAAPTVTTQAVDNILKTKSYGHGNITVANPACSKRGICWNTTGSPTVADSKSEETDSFGVGAFSRQMTGLSAGEHYYVKAYAYNAEGYGYGNEVEFDTLPVDCEVLFPNAIGDEESIPYEYPADADHYTCVDEEFYDDSDSWVSSISSDPLRDLYRLPASSGSGTITRIVVHFRCSYIGTPHDTGSASIKSNSTVTDGVVEFAGVVWKDFTQEWAINPADSQPWEWADIDALQIGVRLETAGLLGNTALCTQVYVVVYYTPAAGWTGGDVNGVAIATIAKINGVALADITKVNGVA